MATISYTCQQFRLRFDFDSSTGLNQFIKITKRNVIKVRMKDGETEATTTGGIRLLGWSCPTPGPWPWCWVDCRLPHHWSPGRHRGNWSCRPMNHHLQQPRVTAHARQACHHAHSPAVAVTQHILHYPVNGSQPRVIEKRKLETGLKNVIYFCYLKNCYSNFSTENY